MPPAKKRKTAPSDERQAAPDRQAEEKPETASTSEEPVVEQTTTAKDDASPPPATSEPTPSSSSTTPANPTPAASSSAANAVQERLARFRALQARAKASSDQNLKEATKESQRLATDPSQLTSLNRKHAIASHKLLKAEIEEAGEDFERKRAWDWTVEETERWDKRMRKKEAHRDDTAFKDYARESEKAYKRQLRNLGAPDLERYTREKMAAIEKAAAAGTLDIVETEDGEMIAVDKDGTFFSTADSTAFAQHKPDKAAVDRLVADLRKAEEASLKKRRERMAKNGDDGGDVTYINEKNKQFNQKLARFYNKYTSEIRESFERGTMV
ncbi:SYF2 splicing factor-domain-containing protein [Achaetomium macrosporum]|uniref:Pre-mRNA-splicing factor SYF2 n=1 Tax=Achaetomium macrosporum TaxID=79813 RepID=A0AAN7CD22_9PEZI|nr:SYF2 splicing factor-domain-containing protein [Achaetomium macrosporum]